MSMNQTARPAAQESSHAMPAPPTAVEGLEALQAHLADTAMRARVANGFYIDLDVMIALLDDRSIVRYPTAVIFDATPLEPGEFAFVQPLGASPSDGFVLSVHPMFEGQPEVLPMLIAYHIPTINYGNLATHVEAEIFGATLLGIDVDTYYEALCELADAIPAT